MFLYLEVGMKIRRRALRSVLTVGLGMGLATSLAAEGSDPGFKWLGLRAGSLFLDSPENKGSAIPLGAQGGMVFEGQRYGFTIDGFQYNSESSLSPGVKLRHRAASATFLSGLSDDSASPLWPYMGLGLGTVSVPEVAPLTFTQTYTSATAAHASLGFIQRPGDAFIWGMEARFVFYLPIKTLQEIQATFLLGFTWGGRSSAPSAGPSTPPPAAPPVAPAPPPAPLIQSPEPPMAPAGPMASPAPETVPAPTPAPATPEPAPPAPPMAEPAPSDSTAAERVEALLRGDIPRALGLSRKHIAALPADRWTLRLGVASLPVTLKNAARAFPGAVPDLFITPIQLRGGKTANQLFLGDYASREAAARAAKAVPAYFLKGRQRPIPILASGIPIKACPMVRPVPTPTPTPTPAARGIAVRSRPSCSRCH